MRLLSIIVGIFHFFMPLIGMVVGETIIHFIKIDPNVIVFLVLFMIGIQMIIESFKETRAVSFLKFSELLLFGFAVSVDSFSVGLGLKTIYTIPIICSIIFSLSSTFFTYLGLYLGKKITQKIGSISTRFGGIMLLIIGFMYLI